MLAVEGRPVAAALRGGRKVCGLDSAVKEWLAK
jgi:hypothetical protein